MASVVRLEIVCLGSNLFYVKKLTCYTGHVILYDVIRVEILVGIMISAKCVLYTNEN